MSEITNASVNTQRNISISQGYFKGAVQKTNIKSRLEFRNIAMEKSNLSTQDLGEFASRISIQANGSKSYQDRFFDSYI